VGHGSGSINLATSHCCKHTRSSEPLYNVSDEWIGCKRTNITEPAQTTYTSSRGHLASSFLLSDSEPPSRPLEDVLDKIVPPDAKFPGFNLLLLAPSWSSKQGERLSFDAVWVTNDGAGGAVSTRPLSDEERHCGGISNGIDGQGGNEWPKVKHGVHALCNLMKQPLSRSHTEAGVVDHLFDILA
jgi:uncharacterized protein with NRDE domain